jgi:hypothetical protein
MIDASDRALLDDSLSGLASRFDGVDLTTALDEFGWLALLDADAESAISSVFLAQGRAVAWSAAFHDTLTADATNAMGFERQTGAVLVPLPRLEITPTHEGSVDALLVGARSPLDWVSAATQDASGATRVVRIDATVATTRLVAGIDPSLAVQRVAFPVDAAEILAEGPTAATWWTDSMARGRLALTYQLCGTIDVMLGHALEHARNRLQFGQLIGTFQAVRTRLADTRVALEGARTSADAVWDCDDRSVAAAVAKLIVSRAYSTAAAHCQQVLAGVGFTTEHPFQLALKQATALDRLLGSALDLGPAIGRFLIARGRIPRLVELEGL